MASPYFFYLLEYLQTVGYFQVVVPFMLIFTALFTLLIKTKLFGKNVTVDAVIAFLLASLAIVNTRVIEWMSFYLGNYVILIVLFAVFMLFFMFMLGVSNTWLKYGTALLAVLATIWFLAETQYYSPYSNFGGGFFSNILWQLQYYDIVNWVLSLFVLALFVGVIIAGKNLAKSKP